jgi:hypothetical protein
LISFIYPSSAPVILTSDMPPIFAQDIGTTVSRLDVCCCHGDLHRFAR